MWQPSVKPETSADEQDVGMNVCQGNVCRKTRRMQARIEIGNGCSIDSQAHHNYGDESLRISFARPSYLTA